MQVEKPAISVVVPVYNNASTLEELTTRLVDHLMSNKLTYEIIYVNDASKDGSQEVINRLNTKYGGIRCVPLLSNLGQQKATAKGLEIASGDRVVVMDADLQDQPELIAGMNTICTNTGNTVFVLRKGLYQSVGKMLTSRILKLAVRVITGLHHRAGSYYMIPRRSVENALAISKRCTYPYMSIVACCSSRGLSYVEVSRSKSASGSSYNFRTRIRAGYRAIHCAVVCARLQRKSAATVLPTSKI